MRKCLEEPKRVRIFTCSNGSSELNLKNKGYEKIIKRH